MQRVGVPRFDRGGFAVFQLCDRVLRSPSRLRRVVNQGCSGNEQRYRQKQIDSGFHKKLFVKANLLLPRIAASRMEFGVAFSRRRNKLVGQRHV